MKISEFNYTKKEGEKSYRKVMSLHSSDGWVDGIDMTKFTEEEINQLTEIQLDYEKKMKPFMDKAFRRFLKEGVEIITEHITKNEKI